jgi:hypothetical protein
MKVAIAISGLPRKVEEGYNQFWKQIIEKYNADVYLHFWEDEEYKKILSLYNPKKYISEKPFSFADYVDGLEADESLSRPTKPYDVAGNFRGFPMLHGWQKVCELVEGDYDYVIRGRYDLGGYCNLEKNEIKAVLLGLFNMLKTDKKFKSDLSNGFRYVT